ncbi:MAG: IgGFc-binding protein [Myxococcota bacterium]|nr:IgGFc-binding protein [Myxococcota bacterium]
MTRSRAARLDWTRALAALALATGCTGGDPGEPPPSDLSCEIEGFLECIAQRELRCVDATVIARDCEHVCVEGRGCLRCEPESLSCEDAQTLAACDAAGEELERRACAAHERCVGTRCADLCGEAAARHDYAGCEYVAVPLANPQLRAGFSFAIVVANASAFSARVRVEGGALDAPITREVAPGATETIVLPWIDELSQLGGTTGGGRSALREHGAYWIRSDVPVLATQWNPLEYRLAHEACEDATACFSYTNDASLLLPLHALGAGHHVMSFGPVAFERPSLDAPYGVEVVGRGLFSVVAVEPGETLVTVHASSPLEAPSGERIEAGTSRDFALAQGTVLQLVAATPRDAEECAPVGRRRQCTAPTLDPTGTRVSSERPVAVFSGHSCAYVPFDRPACDHVEEQILPDVALGRRYALGRTGPLHETAAPNLLRVLSIADGNRVRFDPPIAPELTLDAGEHVLVTQETPVVIEGSAPLLVAQLTVGMEYSAEDPASEGDPAMVLGAPIEQWRRSYVFSVPGTYTSAYASIVAPAGTRVRLDGEPLEGEPTRVGDFEFHDVPLETAAAVHQLEADAPIGLTLHGYAPWTSYLHLGGLTVAPLVH